MPCYKSDYSQNFNSFVIIFNRSLPQNTIFFTKISFSEDQTCLKQNHGNSGAKYFLNRFEKHFQWAAKSYLTPLNK